MSWWRGNRRPGENPPVPQPNREKEDEPLPALKEDRILDLQRSLGNAAVQKLLPSAHGSPIPDEDRVKLETAFGTDLSQVMLHHDKEAADQAAILDANAFTSGRDIYFASGAYGFSTLAHEVTHVLQQRQDTAPSDREDASLEQQADTASARVLSGGAIDFPPVAAAPAIQRQPAPGSGTPPMTLLPSYSLTLDSFDIDSAALSSTHQQQLSALAERIKSTLASAANTFVIVTGFADAPGTDAHNLALGQMRAAIVHDFLISRGVPGNVLHDSSMGEQLPRVDTKKHEAKNRRVEIEVVERSSFKLPHLLNPKDSLQLPPVVPQKPLDLTYRPEMHIPTPQEELQENVKRNEEIWKEAQAILEREKLKPGVSVSDLFGRTAREITRKMGFPEWVQDRAETLAQRIPIAGAQAVFDQIANDRNLDQSAKDAVHAVIEALMKTKLK